MKASKRLLRPERLRQVPEQFRWVDQALVQRHLIDPLQAQAAALYLFLLTVADAQGLSYYGSATLALRLKLKPEESVAARLQLIEQELIAYETPLYQVLALPRAQLGPPGLAPAARSPSPPAARDTSGPVSLGDLLGQLERRRGGL